MLIVNKNRPKSRAQMERELLDMQELAAVQVEENKTLQAQLLDTQELVAKLVEKGGGV